MRKVEVGDMKTSNAAFFIIILHLKRVHKHIGDYDYVHRGTYNTHICIYACMYVQRFTCLC